VKIVLLRLQAYAIRPRFLSAVRHALTAVTIAFAWVDPAKPHGVVEVAAVVATAVAVDCCATGEVPKNPTRAEDVLPMRIPSL